MTRLNIRFYLQMKEPCDERLMVTLGLRSWFSVSITSMRRENYAGQSVSRFNRNQYRGTDAKFRRTFLTLIVIWEFSKPMVPNFAPEAISWACYSEKDLMRRWLGITGLRKLLRCGWLMKRNLRTDARKNFLDSMIQLYARDFLNSWNSTSKVTLELISIRSGVYHLSSSAKFLRSSWLKHEGHHVTLYTINAK